MIENEKTISFPEDFLWGVSTSAYQIEGGITCDWSQWEMSERRLKALRDKKLNYRDYVAGRACDSFHRYEEDARLVKELNCGAYRVGIEWARIEPVEGEFNRAAIEHYRLVLMDLKANNLKAVVTIWHWTNPMWVVHEGGWSNKKIVEYYARYVKFVVSELGDLVDFWVTINEPTVFVGKGYMSGEFPPNKRNPILAVKAFFNLVAAHKKAYDIIHAQNIRTQVSITHSCANYEPAREFFLPEVLLAKFLNFITNASFFLLIKNKYDYIGLNYYHHNRVVWHPPFVRNLNLEVSDFGWEIYPEGIYNILKYLKRFNKPVYIMENGIADASDAKRAKFIKEHLFYVHKAIEEGDDVRGYFHWSLMDNFEWAAGYTMKFGLYAVDHHTFKRTARPSAAVYAEICRTHQITLGDSMNAKSE